MLIYSLDGVPPRSRRSRPQTLPLRAHCPRTAERSPPASTQICLGSKHHLLYPASRFDFTTQVFTQRYPRYLIRIVNRHEEFYALTMLFVERHYLRKHSESSRLASEHCLTVLDASFAENFYGLKRRRHPWVLTDRASAAVRGVPVAEKLRDKEIWQSLFFLVRSLTFLQFNLLTLLRSPFRISEPRPMTTTNNSEEASRQTSWRIRAILVACKLFLMTYVFQYQNR